LQTRIAKAKISKNGHPLDELATTIAALIAAFLFVLLRSWMFYVCIGHAKRSACCRRSAVDPVLDPFNFSGDAYAF